MSAPHHRLSRVLMTADAVGGVWTYSLGLAAGLAQAGVAVELAVMGPPPDDPQRRAAGAIPALRLHESSLKLEWMEDAAGDVARAGDWLLELEARTRPDLVHLNGYAHAVLPFRAPKLVVAHSCVRSWWRAVHGQDPPPVWDAYTRAVTAGLAAADHVVAPSGAMLAALVDGYGPLPSPASVIPNGLPPAAHEQARKRDVVLAAGRIWDAAKNIATLVAVADRLAWPVWIAGDRAPGEGRAAELPGVIALGRLDAAAMARAYADASIYALPARYEPFGLSILEAAQHGCALVLGDIPSLRENWEGAALFVDPADAGGLAGRLADLIADPAARAAWGARARTRAADFSLPRTCAAVLDLYTRLTGVRAAAVPAPSTHKEISACAS
ncbi:MAG TPA: glycosyltransferase family 4 protein [Polyangia bacterium]|nr:glycosyltransferase family 4 protein [Polyangia bacterium]